MTVEELIELLEQHPGKEVRMATQPSWPLQYHLAGVVSSDDLDEFGGDDDRAWNDPGVVWIVEGHPTDHPYAPRDLWDTF